LLACLQHLEAVEDELARLLTSSSQEAFNHRTDEGDWSPAEVIEHLILTTELYLPRLDRAIERGHRRGLEGRSEGIGFFEKKFIEALEPPPKRRFKAPGRFRPPKDLPDVEPNEALERFRASQASLTERIDQADGLPISRMKISSPFSPLLRLRVTAAFMILATHQRRHLWQIRRVLALGETLY